MRGLSDYSPGSPGPRSCVRVREHDAGIAELIIFCFVELGEGYRDPVGVALGVGADSESAAAVGAVREPPQ